MDVIMWLFVHFLQLKYMFPAKKKQTILHRKTTWLELHANEFSAENEISGN